MFLILESVDVGYNDVIEADRLRGALRAILEQNNLELSFLGKLQHRRDKERQLLFTIRYLHSRNKCLAGLGYIYVSSLAIPLDSFLLLQPTLQLLQPSTTITSSTTDQIDRATMCKALFTKYVLCGHTHRTEYQCHDVRMGRKCHQGVQREYQKVIHRKCAECELKQRRRA